MKDKLRDDRIIKLKAIEDLKINPYPYSYDVDSNLKFLKEKYEEKIKTAEHTEDFYKVAGRIVLLRCMGKLTFLTIQDEDLKFQVLMRLEKISDIKKKLLKLLDLGDIIGVYGNIFKTKKGELSILVCDFDILCKCLKDIGDKYHGVLDIEKKYRNRSLDLITNQKSKEILKKRFLITQKIREFFVKKNFLEVETPITQVFYGGACAKPFETYNNFLSLPLYLRVAPELNLKKILVGGMDAIFEINKNFRNEDVDTTHNPEFTMLEAYKSYVDYNYMMKLLEDLVCELSLEINGTTKINFLGSEIDVKTPWKKISVKDALNEVKNFDVDKMCDEELFLEVKKLKKDMFHKTRGEAILILFEEFCEKYFKGPIHFIDYPKESTVFCKKKRGDENLIERFESFICGVELANAYSELNDSILQRKYLEQQNDFKNCGADETWGEVDTDFLDAMDLGMPPAGGIGIGIDRLVMILLNQNSIRDIIYFPTIKPKDVKEKNTKVAVALINKSLNLKDWEKLNAAAHLSSTFSAKVGRGLFYQEKIKTKDDEEIFLNMKHAIVIKNIDSNEKILEVLKKAKKSNLEISTFTRDMITSSSDKKVIEKTKEKNLDEIEFLGILIFGDKKIVDGLTGNFELFE